MAKVLYSGASDWMIGPYAYVYYGEGSPLVIYKSEWPDRLMDTEWPEATEKKIRYLIECIFLATGIEVK